MVGTASTTASSVVACVTGLAAAASVAPVVSLDSVAWLSVTGSGSVVPRVKSVEVVRSACAVVAGTAVSAEVVVDSTGIAAAEAGVVSTTFGVSADMLYVVLVNVPSKRYPRKYSRGLE